jgi:hypothetical protein
MRVKRGVLSLDPLAVVSDPAESAPIFAVLAQEPVFGQIAREAHAHLLAAGNAEPVVDQSIRQMLARAGVVF